VFVLMKVQTASASGLPEESITSAPEAASRTLKMTQFRGFRIRYTSPKVPLSSSPRSVDKAIFRLALVPSSSSFFFRRTDPHPDGAVRPRQS
jgi:hypothetical protein